MPPAQGLALKGGADIVSTEAWPKGEEVLERKKVEQLGVRNLAVSTLLRL